MRFFIKFSLIVSLFLSNCSVFADTPLVQRKNVQHFIQFMVKTHGFDRKNLIDTFNQVNLQPSIIESMEKPYEKKPWDTYKNIFLTQQRLKGGIEFWKKNQIYLAKAEKVYGVPAPIIVSIIGVETLYGNKQGEYRVIDALSTLAFNYPKRSPFFTKELAEFLLLCREHHVPPTQYLGSYAGAMGKPQFMPSSYRFYAANFDGKTKKDLMQDDEAVIASVANYLHKHGWKLNDGVATPAKVIGTGYKHIKAHRKTATYTASQLAKAGVISLSPSKKPANKLGLIELNNTNSVEYWLAYPNFYVITRYNTSPQYAMAVFLLAQQLKEQWVATVLQSRPFAYA